MDENKEFKECNCDEKSHHDKMHAEEHKAENWAKFALLLLALFIACYLAVYYVMDQMRHTYYVPARMDSIDNVIQEQDKLFKDMSTLPMHYNAMMVVKNPVETYKDDENDSYKIIINLKPFNNDPKNIKVDIKENKISISGQEEKTGKNAEQVYAFSQSFVLPEKIEVDKVLKEKSGNKYIITLPIDD